MRRRGFLLFVAALPLLVRAEHVDLSVLHRIQAEAFQNSKVMEYAFYLTDVYGPRVAGSPGYRAAAEWVVRTAREIGLENPRLEKIGPIGRGWSFSRFSAHIVEPVQAPLIGFPLAWTGGTEGPVTAEAVLAVVQSEADFNKFKGQLKGKIVLTDPARQLEPRTAADFRRLTDAELAERARAPEPGQAPFFIPVPRPGGQPPSPQFRQMAQARETRAKLARFLREEGALAVVTAGLRGDYGTVFAASGGSRDLKDPLPLPTIALASEHYNRLVRLLERKIPVKLELDVRVQIEEKEVEGYNVLADLPGTRKKDELVMVGAHLDSWHGGTGAADNAAGCAVMMEVMRILKTLGLKMDRTVRMALWDGEELGFLGSRAYVRQYLADRETMTLKPDFHKFSVYFNLDNGAGRIRGVYLQGNDMARPIFEAWLAPFRDLGVTTVTIANTGGTDHLSFDAVGLPGFQFLQDPLDYSTRVHHSNMDVYDRLPRSDLMQASAVIASCVYHAATRPDLMPRKPLPPPAQRAEPAKSVPSN
ncbi:MAG: M20/M25/M40 family metallo-hydrolase [Bryobacterales bacterium]|nr:M20/M25/M40 family metallo-hydrolase [Bryobacterales bacterium]